MLNLHMVQTGKYDHFHLLHHFTVPLIELIQVNSCFLSQNLSAKIVDGILFWVA